MSDIVSLISRHGYLVIVALVFAEAIGLPVPAAVALVAAGAAVGSRVLRAEIVLPLALTAMVLGDTLLFVAGRYTGWALLGFLCKVSANPETCILRSAESFYKRSKVTLLIAKFIPGVNTMGPPLAGSRRVLIYPGVFRAWIPGARFSEGDRRGISDGGAHDGGSAAAGSCGVRGLPHLAHAEESCLSGGSASAGAGADR